MPLPELLSALERVNTDNFGGTDRRQLMNLLWDCENMYRRSAREQIVKDLSEAVRAAIRRDEQNDLLDIRGIIDACLDYRGGLKELITIVSDYERGSEKFEVVENYFENFFYRTPIVALNPEEEKQIQQLLGQFAQMNPPMIINTAELEQLYCASAPQPPFLDTTWRYPRNLNLADAFDWVLHHLNVAPPKQEIPAIVLFAERLAQYAEDARIQSKLRAWVDACINNEALPRWQISEQTIIALRTKPAEYANEQVQKTEPFTQSLMIQIEPVDNRAADERTMEQFTVKGWLKYGPAATACKCLEVAQEYQTCDRTTILELLDNWLDEELDATSTIEFFLPREYFHLRVDEWKIPSEEGKMLGVLYQVVIRSSERFDKAIRRAKSRWLDNWGKIKQFHPGEVTLQWLNDLKEYDGERVFYKLLNEKMVGLWLLISPCTIDPGDKHKKVFWNMLRAGIPVALWLKDPCNGHEGQAIEGLLALNRLADLPRLLFEQRLEAANLLREAVLCNEEVKDIHHPGRCFTLFWDDPTRVPYEYAIKFQETGIRR